MRGHNFPIQLHCVIGFERSGINALRPAIARRLYLICGYWQLKSLLVEQSVVVAMNETPRQRLIVAVYPKAFKRYFNIRNPQTIQTEPLRITQWTMFITKGRSAPILMSTSKPSWICSGVE
jgi:hypothetical protein